MKWVEIDGTHINTSQIQTFFWEDGELFVLPAGRSTYMNWDDSDRHLYLKLCHQLGVRPAEEVRENV